MTNVSRMLAWDIKDPSQVTEVLVVDKKKAADLKEKYTGHQFADLRLEYIENIRTFA